MRTAIDLYILGALNPQNISPVSSRHHTRRVDGGIHRRFR